MKNKIRIAGDFVEHYNFQLDTDGLSHPQGGHGWSKSPVRTPENARNMHKRLLNITRSALKRDRGIPYFVTFTVASIEGTWDREKFPFITSPLPEAFVGSIDYVYPLFTEAMKRLQYAFPDLSYIAVPEFQDKRGRGAVHFHTLMWGLPLDLELREIMERPIASIWRHGFVDVKITDGSEKLSHYLVKYLKKCSLDSRLYGKKAYTRSRNIPLPVEIATDVPLLILEQILSDNVIQKGETLKWYSEWLGHCEYTLYYNP